jgi:uncharacterized low-complexity protein
MDSVTIKQGVVMKKMGLMALLFGAALFIGLGATSAMAAESGKCGASKPAKCGEGKAMTKGKCGNATKPSKCSGEKKMKPAGKCGAGKCGSNK